MLDSRLLRPPNALETPADGDHKDVDNQHVV